MRWNARGVTSAYDSSFGYVSAQGAPLVELLDPRPGERVLDLGCGTGVLTAEVAARGARVLGIDGSPGMIEKALAQYPGLDFIIGDGHDFSVAQPYDAVLSNAALHWMSRDPDLVIGNVRDALQPGGRFVAELGGSGNCAALIAAVSTAWREYGLREPELPWFFPSPAEYASRLEKGGFAVRLLEYFDRPTSLDECPDGAADWVRLFGAPLLEGLPGDIVEPLLRRVNELAAPALRRETGWMADYVRLRFAAVRR
ncbi:class I SAM-dependent methyltransferase [Streptosporangium sp. KLBMP 9127]|nr:class I SAM-dependent methyltransferase [Streptosporangium sp. KLBMP 9127]